MKKEKGIVMAFSACGAFGRSIGSLRKRIQSDVCRGEKTVRLRLFQTAKR